MMGFWVAHPLAAVFCVTAAPLQTLLAHSTMARQQTAVVLCLAAAVILQLLVPAQAHMVMIDPKSRQWLDYTLRYNYNPHAVNGGGAQLAERSL